MQPNKPLNWSNLPKNKCPQCGKDFLKGLKTMPIAGQGQMMFHNCGFKISEKRYAELSVIVNGHYTGKQYDN